MLCMVICDYAEKRKSCTEHGCTSYVDSSGVSVIMYVTGNYLRETV
jgi:hypothetical protein